MPPKRPIRLKRPCAACRDTAGSPPAPAAVTPRAPDGGGGRGGQMAAGFALAPSLLERPAEAELREVVHWIAIHDSLELARRRLVAACSEVGAAQRLADRALLRLHGARLLERYRRRREITMLQQVTAAAEEVVDALGAL